MRKTMRIAEAFVFSLIVFLGVNAIGAEKAGRIVGQVLNAETGEPLIGASVILLNSKLGAFCDDEGRFVIEGVPAGLWDLQVSMIGYKSQMIEDVRVEPDGQVTLSFTIYPIPIRMNEIVVTATRRASNIMEITSFASAVSEDEVRRSAATDVGELLRNTASLGLNDYGPGGPSLLSLRGSSTSQVLVLVDGERINNTQSGWVDLDNLSLDMVERVEVVRGGYSALYGSNAVGGVVNIITRRPERTLFRGWSEVGSFGALRWGTEVALASKQTSGLLSFSKARADGDFEFRDKFGRSRRRENADSRTTELFSKIEWRPSRRSTLTLSGEGFSADRGDPGPIGQYSPNAFREEKMSSFKVALDQEPSKRLRYKVLAYGRRFSQHYFNPDLADDIHKISSRGGELQGDLKLWRDSSLISGASYHFDGLRSTKVGNRSREALGLYAQQELKWKALAGLKKGMTLFPAIRLDSYSDFNAGLSPSLGISLALRSITLKANLGRSYRAPTLNDLYWPEDSFAKGNPHLGPERVFNFDVGFSYAWSGPMTTWGSLAYFENRFHDEIVWQPGQSGKWSPRNLSKSKTRGFEAEVNLSALRGLLDFKGNYTFLKAQDSQGRQLIYRPRHSGGYRISLERGKFRLAFEGEHIGKRFYTLQNTRWLKPHAVHDLTLWITGDIFGVEAEVGLFLENIFDVHYQKVADYPLPGRRWSLRTSLGI